VLALRHQHRGLEYLRSDTSTGSSEHLRSDTSARPQDHAQAHPITYYTPADAVGEAGVASAVQAVQAAQSLPLVLCDECEVIRVRVGLHAPVWAYCSVCMCEGVRV
jgi:hypothetical protein